MSSSGFLVEGAIAALPDHLGLGDRDGGGFAHRDQLRLGLAVDDRYVGDVPGAGPPTVTSASVDWTSGPGERGGEGRTL